MRYTAARYSQKRRGDVYRIYISECLRIVSENTAKTFTALSRGSDSGSYMEKRFIDIINGTSTAKKKPQPGEPTKNIRRLFS